MISFGETTHFRDIKSTPVWNRKIQTSVIHAGDIEYYDKPLPWALTKELMRFKWSRIFSLPSNRAFYTNHTSYFLKDDHDTLKNDCWPGQTYGSVTFEQGRISSTTNSFQPPKNGSQPSIGARICKSGCWKVEISGAQTTLTMDQRRAS